MRYLLILCFYFSPIAVANNCSQLNKKIEHIVNQSSGIKMQKQLRRLNRQCDSPLPLLVLAEYFDKKGQITKASNYYEVAEEYAEGAPLIVKKMVDHYSKRAKYLLTKNDFCSANLFIQRAKALKQPRIDYPQLAKSIEALALYRANTLISTSQIDCFLTRSLKRKKSTALTLNLSVNFELNKSHLNQNGLKQVDELIDVLGSKNIRKLSIIGHSDLSGEVGYNLELSKKRAKTIQLYIEQNLASFDFHLSSFGRGESQPIISNESEVAGKINRRVEFEFE